MIAKIVVKTLGGVHEIRQMNDSAIALSSLRKSFGKVVAVDSATLEIGSGEFFSLLGPSGCGKTTMLRLIAGFETPDGGELRIGGEEMRGIPPQRRPVNTVFQNYALFPHLNVFENVAFGLRMRKTADTEVQKRVDNALEMLHVTDLKDRLPAEISGGQKQRVALARALVMQPKLLLLDEPLAAVDAQRRAQVREDLKALQRHSRTTFLYVTHDQDEALSLSDRLAVMDGGRIVQVGTPREVYERPKNRFVASFLGRCNIFHGTVVQHAPGGLQVETPLGKLRLSGQIDPGGKEVLIAIRAEQVTLNSTAIENSFSMQVTGISYTGALAEYSLGANGQTLRVARLGAGDFAVGDHVKTSLPREALFLLEQE